jgi:hypothetical protein
MKQTLREKNKIKYPKKFKFENKIEWAPTKLK